MNANLRLDPGMSIQTGSEYVYARPARRGEIVRQCVEGTKSYASAYAQVDQKLHLVVHNGGIDLSRLSSVRSSIAAGGMRIDRKLLAQEAVNAAERNLSAIRLPKGLQLVSWNERQIIRPIETVELRARPFALLVDEHADAVVGAMLVRFKKQPFESRSGQLAADLLRRAVEAHVDHEVVPKHCLVVDAFADRTYIAPTRTQRLRRECEDGMYALVGEWRARTAA